MRRIRGTILLICLVAAPAFAGGEEARLERAWREAETPEARAAVVEKLADVGSDRAVDLLVAIVDGDPDAWVRETAVWALSRIGSESAAKELVTLLVRGGPVALRGRIAEAIAGVEGGRELLIGALGKEDLAPVDRILLIGAFAAFDDAVTRHRLYSLARSDDPVVRTEALRALGSRADTVADLPMVLADALRKRRDVATTMLVLDLIEARPDPSLLGVLEDLPPAKNRALAAAVRHAIATVKHEKAKRVAAAAADDGYGVPEPPGKPKPRPRHDLVFAFDATYSMIGATGRVRRRIRERIDELGAEMADVRVGIVAFRQERKGVNWRPPQILPLTHDLGAAEEFLASIESGGVDSQGAAIHYGFRYGVERMAWRPDAERDFTIFVDSRCHDFAECRRIVLRHRDDVSMRIVWCGRKVPEDVRRLAALAGTGLGTPDVPLGDGKR